MVKSATTVHTSDGSAIQSFVNITAQKKQEKKLPSSFKADLEGYRMTAAWARKQINQYGGDV